MKFPLLIARFYVMFVGFVLLGGQFWFSDFVLGATIAGICGMLTGIVGENVTGPSITKKRKTRFLAIGGLVGIFIWLFELVAFYDLNIYEFSWFMIGPYCIALIGITIVISKQE